MSTRTLLLTSLLLAATGCPEIRDDHFACPDGLCPSGFVCHPDDVCRRGPVEDAGMADVPNVDAPPIPDDVGPDTGTDTGTDSGQDAPDAGPVAPPVDLLFLIDASASMATAQMQLRESFPDFILAMATGGFPGEDPMFPPLTDIHVGVITPYMGTADYFITTCGEEPRFGHDGVLRTESAGSGCSSLPPWLEYDGSMTSAFERDFTCKAQVGMMGCGFEQQLEAVAKAVTPSDAPLRFYRDSPGHADRGNDGFFRDDAVLVIVLISDEDDCSVQDPEFYDQDSTRYPASLNLRCIEYADEDPGPLHPIARYADLLDDFDRPVVFAPLVGLPASLEGEPFATILADDRMQYAVDPSDETRPRNVCERGVGGVSAFAGRRYVHLGQQLERVRSDVRFELGSICQSSYAGFAERVIGAVFDLAN